jgi:hypothetical protein
MIYAGASEIANIGIVQYRALAKALGCKWSRLPKMTLVSKLHNYPPFISWYNHIATCPDGYIERVSAILQPSFSTYLLRRFERWLIIQCHQ